MTSERDKSRECHDNIECLHENLVSKTVTQFVTPSCRKSVPFEILDKKKIYIYIYIYIRNLHDSYLRR